MPLLSILRGALGAIAIALAQAACAASPPAAEEALRSLTRAQRAVVGLEVTAAEDATSAQTLGRRRQGSGVVMGPDGLVLTIGYLILEADAIRITTHDGRTLPARPVAYDLATGFGLVRPLLPLRGVDPVPLGSADELEPGTPLMAATGSDGGEVGLVRLVSKRPFSGYWEYHIEVALFTAPPLRDHSGAPLFNRRGELLGIGSLFVGQAMGDALPLPGNMFVPVDLLKPILAEMEQTGTSRASRRAWLGLNAAEQGGRVQVLRVAREGPAQAAGLAPGDVVLAIDGEDVSTLEALYKKLWSQAEPDRDVQLTVLQGAQVRQVTVHATDRMRTMRRPAGI